MKIKSLFTSGKMNKDADERLVPNGEYRDALNVRINNSNGSDVGAIENTLSNLQVTSLSLGSNAQCIGVVDDDGADTVFWAVSSDSGSYVCSYNRNTGAQAIILQDTRALSSRVLDFSGLDYVDMAVLNDQENGKKFILLTDGVSEPKYFRVENTIADDSFTLAEISLIKAPPIDAPQVTLIETNESENNIKDKFYSFAYRYIYEDNEISALSPFSEFAFMPSTFRYDYNSGNNKSMFNDKNKARLTVNTGGSRVRKIEVIAKESDTNAYYILDKINKDTKGLSDNASYNFDFTNNKVLKALDISQTRRVYDNVPVSAKAVELIGNRVVFGGYTEGYDISYGGVAISPELSLQLSSTAGASGVPHTSLKSNMDYEVGITYLDGKGRMTTPFTSENNSIHIPLSASDKENTISVSISSKAPDWATNYRFFVKQSRNDYDVISPVSFYKEGIYAWIKLEGEDVNKVKKGDFLFVKSDTSGIKRSQIKVKVLESEFKDKNFLEDDLEESTKQQAGNYIKVNTEEISLDETSTNTFVYKGYAFRSDATANNIEGNQSYVEDPVFYGEGTDDLSVAVTIDPLNNPLGFTDFRYEIKIMESTETYKWRKIDLENYAPTSWDDNGGLGYSTSTPLTLDTGVVASFASTSGHIDGDRWVINTKSLSRPFRWRGGDNVDSYGRNAIMLFKCKDSGSESVNAGSIITLEFNDGKSDDSTGIKGNVFQRFIASNNYANLEEWFWEDDVLSQMTHPETGREVMFRRGSLLKTNGEQMTVDSTGELFLCILSSASYYGSGKVRVDTNLKVLELEKAIIFETDYKNAVSEVFYEIPGTYGIDSNGNHLGDVNQVFGTTDAVVNLDYFNCFGWYNGYESIKIADAFNEKKMLNDSKPLVPIDNYKQINRVASLTYSNVYESTTSYNGLNEFNLSTANYKDLDANYGTISRILSSNGDLTVFQSNRVSRILYNKNVILAADGSGTIAQSNTVLGQDVPYQGEYGITNGQASLVRWGGGIFFADEKRGSVLRLGANGIIPISAYGMDEWFNDNLTYGVRTVGTYDPQNDQYIISLRDNVIEWREDTYECLQDGITTTTSTSTTSTTSSTTSTTSSTTSTTSSSTTTTTTEGPVTSSTTTTQGPETLTITGDTNINTLGQAGEVYSINTVYSSTEWQITDAAASGFSPISFSFATPTTGTGSGSVTIDFAAYNGDGTETLSSVITVSEVGGSATGDITIVQDPGIQTIVDISGDFSNILEYNSRDYTAVVTGTTSGTITYAWSVTGGVINGSSTSETVNVTWQEPGTGSLSVTVTRGGVPDTDSGTITILPIYYIFNACDGGTTVISRQVSEPPTIEQQRYADYSGETIKYYTYSGFTQNDSSGYPIAPLQPIIPIVSGCPATTTTTSTQAYQQVILYEQSPSYGSGWDSTSYACAGVGGTNTLLLYIGTNETLSVNTVIYTDTSLSVPFAGDNYWYQVQGTSDILNVAANGTINTVQACSPTTIVFVKDVPAFVLEGQTDQYTSEVWSTETGTPTYSWTVTRGSITAGDGTATIDVLWSTDIGTGTVALTATVNGVSGSDSEDLEVLPIYYIFNACDGGTTVIDRLASAPSVNQQRYVDFSVTPNEYYTYTGTTQNDSSVYPIVDLQPVTPTVTGCPTVTTTTSAPITPVSLIVNSGCLNGSGSGYIELSAVDGSGSFTYHIGTNPPSDANNPGTYNGIQNAYNLTNATYFTYVYDNIYGQNDSSIFGLTCEDPTTTTAAPTTTTTTTAAPNQSWTAERNDGGAIGRIWIAQGYNSGDSVLVDDGSGICWTLGTLSTLAGQYTITGPCPPPTTTTTTTQGTTTTAAPVCNAIDMSDQTYGTLSTACQSGAGSGTNRDRTDGDPNNPQIGDTIFEDAGCSITKASGIYFHKTASAAVEIGGGGLIVDIQFC
jgi:hypothetical protein